MKLTTATLVFAAMVLLTAVSMWTTYVSLHDSILPEPTVEILLPGGGVWDCSIVALGLSLAIGLMLFALKVAVIGGQKRLSIVGVTGMTVVAFISIAFNMDVLYRTADREFFLRYSKDRMRGVYEEYLADVQGALTERRVTLLRELAKQEGELDAEIKGLREAPAGYGPVARGEDYKLTLLQKTAEVEIQSVEDALKVKAQADDLLRSSAPASIAEIDKLQGELRVLCKDLAGVSAIPMPGFVRLESPLFAVFAKLFDLKSVGLKEVFFLIIAFFLDLGDIIGYSLVPNREKKRRHYSPEQMRSLAGAGPERVVHPAQLGAPGPGKEEAEPVSEDIENVPPGAAPGKRRRAHAFRIRPR